MGRRKLHLTHPYKRISMQLSLDDQAIALALDRLLPELEAQGVDPKVFALRLLYRMTLDQLQPFTSFQRQQFAVWLVEDILSDDD